MSRDYITRLRHRGFFKRNSKDKDASLYLATPYKVIVNPAVTKTLRTAYLHTEETGGILWAKARTRSGKRELVLEKVSFVRNAIEDLPRSDGRTKAGTYLPDAKEHHEAFQSVVEAEYLPVNFHTHPINGANIVEEMVYRNRNMDTSEADRRESTRLHQIFGFSIHLPRALVMGNTIGKELFIRMYGGNNSPLSFAEASKEVMHDNLSDISSLFDWESYSKTQKILIGTTGALLALGAIIKPKVALSIAVVGTPLAMSFLTHTKKPSPHYCRLSDDKDAIILVPDIG